MRTLTAMIVALLALPCFAQTESTVVKVEANLKTLKYISSLEDPSGGFKVDKDAKPSVRAINGAARAWRYLEGDKHNAPFPNKAKHVAYVKASYDANTGAFAEKGMKPDVASTAVGILTAVELGIPETDFPKALDYLKANAKTFEEVRIGAAALEALKKKPDWVKDWFAIKDEHTKKLGFQPAKEDGARELGGQMAMMLRLKEELPKGNYGADILRMGQRPDGGFGKGKTETSDLESTYRVMRAFYLLKEYPKDVAALREFIGKCRNADGGYSVEPGKPSTMSGVYYAVIIEAWIAEMN